MRTMLLILTLLLIPASAMARAPADPVQAINATLDALHDAASKAEGPRYFDLYSADAIYIGTDAGERWTLAQFKDYATPYFSKGQGWTYVPRERHVVLAPVPCRCVAWFDELLDSRAYGSSRGTGVLVLQGGVWKVAQYALTFPIPNDLAKHMTDEIKRFEAGEKVH